MAILAKANLTAATDNVLYTTPDGSETLGSVAFCNRNANSSALVRLGILASAENAVSESNYIEFDAVIEANGTLERTGIYLAAGEKIYVRSNVNNVTVVALGRNDTI